MIDTEQLKLEINQHLTVNAPPWEFYPTEEFYNSTIDLLEKSAEAIAQLQNRVETERRKLVLLQMEVDETIRTYAREQKPS